MKEHIIVTEDISPHKKKSDTASTSLSKKRSDHKHVYSKAVLETFFGWEWGQVCETCGRIKRGSELFSRELMKPEAIKKAGISVRDWLSEEEIRQKYPEVKIIKYGEKGERA